MVFTNLKNNIMTTFFDKLILMIQQNPVALGFLGILIGVIAMLIKLDVFGAIFSGNK